jgi:hypothetical protein
VRVGTYASSKTDFTPAVSPNILSEYLQKLHKDDHSSESDRELPPMSISPQTASKDANPIRSKSKLFWIFKSPLTLLRALKFISVHELLKVFPDISSATEGTPDVYANEVFERLHALLFEVTYVSELVSK